MNEFEPTFRFKRFGISDRRCGMKVGTDGVVLGAWAECGVRAGKILDVGAGCGVIALMMAQRYPEAEITAVEIDPGAADEMRVNVAHSPWEGRIAVVNGDFRDVEGRFDLIVSNPPFFVNGDIAPDEARAKARHADSLSPLSLIEFAATHLEPEGRLAMIVPVESSADVEAQAAFARLSVAKRVELATSRRRGVTRVLWELSPSPTPLETGTMTVGDEKYVGLTKDFYLHY